MTATLISAIKARLAEVARTVPNIKRAYSEAPQSLPEGDMPIFCPFVGPTSNFEKHGEEMGEETRMYLMRVYVKNIGTGYDGDTEKLVEPFVTSLRDTFLSHPALGLGSSVSQIPFVTQMEWLGDSGIAVLPFAGANFLGVEFRINVSTLVQIGIANYE